MQLQNTRKAVANHIENILISMKGLKFVETLRVTFEKKTGHEERVIKTDKCHICEKEYNKTDVRVRDHCHVTGQYR